MNWPLKLEILILTLSAAWPDLARTRVVRKITTMLIILSPEFFFTPFAESLVLSNGEGTPAYRMIFVARANKSGGIVRPICFAVFKLITNSNFVGCSTGRSAGLAPSGFCPRNMRRAGNCPRGPPRRT